MATSPADPLALLEARLDGWRPDHVGTLVFVVRSDEVLLIRKKRGHGMGKLNGPGGKLDPGEAPRDGVIRETAEEVGIALLDPVLHGVFRFVDLVDDQWLGYVFVAHAFRGTPHETAEAAPHWYPRDALPFDEMWDDDRHWLPRVLAGERLEGDFLFDAGRLLAHRLRPLGPIHDDGAR